MGFIQGHNDFLIVQNNWDEIPNFGYKPRWMEELKPPSDKNGDNITRPLNEKNQEKMWKMQKLDEEILSRLPLLWVCPFKKL